MSQAAIWFEKAANAGNTQAMRALGSQAKLDPQKAVQWYKKAADNGDSNAFYCLGRIFYTGKGVERDYKQAHEWFLKGAEKNNVECFFQLGYMAHFGQGTAKNDKAAIEWYEKAANRGHDKAMYNIGVLLSKPEPSQFTWRTYGLAASVAILATILIAGCIGSGTTKPPARITTPPGATPTLHETSIATTQISSKLGQASTSLDKNVVSIKTTADKIAADAYNGKAVTPESAKALNKWWDSIVLSTGSLYQIKDDTAKTAQQLKDLQERTGDLSRQINEATAAGDQLEKWWENHDKEQSDAIAALTKDNDGLKKSLHDVLRNKLVWIIVATIPILGIFIALGVMVNPLLGKAGAIACGVVIGVATFLGETLWLLPYILIAISVLAIGFLVWQAIAHRKAITEILQNSQKMKQLLPDENREFLFGKGAFEGHLHESTTKATDKFVQHFKKYIRLAKPGDSSLPMQPLAA